MCKSDSSIMYIWGDDESLQRDLFEIYDYLWVDYSDRVFHVLNKNVIDHLKVLLPELEHFKNLWLVITNENIIPFSSCVSFIDDVNIWKLIGAQKKWDTLSNYKDIIRILNDNYDDSFEDEAESSDSFLTAFKADYNDLLKFSAILCDVDSIADLDDVGIGFKNSGIDLSFSDGKVKNLLLYAKLTWFTKKDLEHRLKGWSSVISEISQINIDFKRQLYNLFWCICFKNLIDFRGINGCMSNNLYNVLDFEKDGNRVGFAKLIADLYHSVDRWEDSYVYKLGTGEELICRYSEDNKLIIGKLYEVAGNIFRFKGSIESNSAFDSRNLRHGIIDYDDFYVNNCVIDDFDIEDHNVYSNDVNVLLCHGESCDLIHNCNFDINFLSKYLKLDLSDSDIQNIQLYSKLSCFWENAFIDIFRHWFSRIDRICCMHPKFLKQLYPRIT